MARRSTTLLAMQNPAFQGSDWSRTSGNPSRIISGVPSELALSTTWTTIGPDSSECLRSDSRQRRTCSRAPVDTTITISSSGSLICAGGESGSA